MVEASIAYDAWWAMSKKSEEDDVHRGRRESGKIARKWTSEKTGNVHDEADHPAGNSTTSDVVKALLPNIEDMNCRNSNPDESEVDVDADDAGPLGDWGQWVESQCVIAVGHMLGRVVKLSYVIDSDVEFEGVKSHVGWKRVRVQGTWREMLG